MSSLWTPGGEHPVDRDADDGDGDGGADAGAGTPSPDTDDPLAGLSPEERAQAEELMADMAEAQQRLAEAPVEDVISNHAIGLYQLAAIHLGQNPPNFTAAQLAIDAMAALIDGVQGRLGEHETALRDALSQIRLAFVQVKGAVEGGETTDG